ncbi:MAG: DeoR/GlpR family DNA-binding transcription regulator [Pseudomonadota bacterium]
MAIAMNAQNQSSDDDERLFIHDRWNRITRLVREDRVTSVDELAEELTVSAATIRRDLNELAESGRVKRVRGGAIAVTAPSGPLDASPNLLPGQTLFSASASKNVEAKKAIGERAAALCEPGEAIIIDGGTTTYQLASHLGSEDLTVLTTSVLILNALVGKPRTRIVITGGEVFHEQNVILNPYRNEIVKNYSATKLFIGAQAVSAMGLMQTDPLLVKNEQELIAQADRVILLADSSKFDARASLAVCGLDAVHTVVTDDGLSPQHRRMLEDQGILVLIAESQH